jgi:ATP-dependent Lhr-like helicase
MLEAARAGRSALLVAATGAGKTLAGFLPSLVELAHDRPEGLHTLYISPLKALAVDVQRNLLGPVEEMGLPIKIETRTGDTPSDRKARQRASPPHMLLTTPESLSLLLSHADSPLLFAGLKMVVVDEIHAFATQKRGDLLALALSRLEKLAPGLRRVGLSATVADPDAYRAWLAPARRHGRGRAGARRSGCRAQHRDHAAGGPARALVRSLRPLGRAPGNEADRAHRPLWSSATREGLCELIFQDLWTVNEHALPIGIHHGSLSIEARRKVEAAMASGKLRGLVCTSSLDSGIDWGDVDLGHPDGRAQGLLAPAPAHRPRQSPARRAVGGDPRPRQPLRISGGARGLSTRSRKARSIPDGSAPARSTCSPSMSWRWPAPARSTRPSCSPRSPPQRLMRA